MDSGYYAACAGLSAQTQALDLIANNVANLNTTGYRAQQQTFQSLVASASGEFANPLNRALNNFNVLGDTRTDLSGGSLQATGNATDLGIEGAGFFVAQTQAGTAYTRNGNFQISTTGQLLTQAGDPVLGEQGPINVPSGPLSISADGTLSVNGAVVDTLRLVELAPGSSPAAVGTSYYSAPDNTVQPAAHSSVRQGMLEASNVNPVTAVVDLLAIQRRAEMLERAMSAFYSNFNKVAANDLPHV
ncbi:MAG: flagellar basal-body rod protein FlgF [Terriglobales bacterium]|jgi:flagellar basal-body rod protein FlgF